MLSHLTHKTSYKRTIVYTYKTEEKNQRHTPILSQYYRGYTALLARFNPDSTYERYHLLNMLFASIIIVSSYLLALSNTKSRKLALILPSFILLSPKFLGHIPANPKDMPFAVIYFLALSTILRF